jgi:hypothetical protein
MALGAAWRPDELSGRRITIAALAAAVAWQVSRTLDGNLTRLHPPGRPGAGIGALGDPDRARTAIATWAEARVALRPFEPWSGPALVTLHGIVTLVAVTVGALAASAVTRRLERAIACLPDESPRASLAVLLQTTRRLGIPVAAAGWAVAAVARAVAVWADDPGAVVRVVVLAPSIGGWLAAAGSVAAIALAALAVERRRTRLLRELRRSPAAVRLLLALAVAVVGLLSFGAIGLQAEDLLRRWIEGSPLDAVAGVIGLAAYLAAVAWAARIVPSAAPSAPSPSSRALVAAGVGSGALGAVAHAVLGVGTGVAALGAGLTVVGLLSIPVAITARAGARTRPGLDETTIRPPRTAAGLRIAAALPPLGLLVLTARLGATELVTRPGPEVLGLVVLAAVFAAAAVAGPRMVTAAIGTGTGPARWEPAVVGLSAAAVPPMLVWAGGLGLPRAVGSLGLVLWFLAQTAVVLAALAWWVERRRVPAALTVAGFERVPVVSILVVWALLGGFLDRDSDFHDIRRVQLAVGAGPDRVVDRVVDRAEILDRFETWLQAQPGLDSDEPVPLVLVSAAGGGVRAAAWTTTVLECLFGPDPRPGCDRRAGWDRVFAAAGASGGSVGLATFTAATLAAAPAADLDADHLAAGLAWQLFVEIPLALPRLHVPADRAERLERSWSADGAVAGGGGRPCWAPPVTGRGGDGPVRPLEVPALSLADLPEGCAAPVPLLLFNGTNAPDGCRVVIGPVDAAWTAATAGDGRGAPRDCPAPAPGTAGSSAWAPSTHDLTDTLCPDEDLPLVTAAFLSARFPLVSPAGRIAANAGCASASGETLVVVDGGYRDNVGAGTLADLWSVLAPAVARAAQQGRCVRPVWLDVDTGYAATAPPLSGSPVFELLRPLEAVSKVFGSRTDDAVDAFATALAGATTTCRGREVRAERVTISLHEHPGLRLPLGWTLSSRSLDDLDRQLGVEENRRAVARLGDLLGAS